MYIRCQKYPEEDYSNFPFSFEVWLVFMPSPHLKLRRSGFLKILMKNTADFVFLHLHSYCSSILNSAFSCSLLTSSILSTEVPYLPPFTLSALHSSDTTMIKGKAKLRLCGESFILSLYFME